ncbi:hypothetical protein GWI33_004108 [Rhynchophorus ferrugineus]|uniref:Uncharacterized protein n=1 Tax=Rhynchophorus ferrugineus TaxID=354439 RepID=A0A834MH01_RHYFE|nr:hypothetical protein GWI33_004108 [Rhynchophorus ferrugineus]
MRIVKIICDNDSEVRTCSTLKLQYSTRTEYPARLLLHRQQEQSRDCKLINSMAGSLRPTADLLQTIQSNIIDEAEDFLPTRPDLVSRDQNNKVPQHKFGDPMTRFNLQQQLIFLIHQDIPEVELHFLINL